MGIYIFNTETLLKALISDADDTDSKHDFGTIYCPTCWARKR